VTPARGPSQELVDVVDADDRVVATVPRAEVRAQRLRHRAVFVVVTSASGELLVHRRSAGKDIWPGRWDVAVGGVVASGEAYDDAARREVAEEIGIVAEPLAIGGGEYCDVDVDLVARCYRIVHDGPFRFVDGEVSEVRWVDLPALAALRARSPFVPDSTALLPLAVLFPSAPLGTHMTGSRPRVGDTGGTTSERTDRRRRRPAAPPG
jgi:isopentenyldiphosphate isomerase